MAEEVLVVLVSVEFHAQVEVARPLLGLVERLRLFLQGRFLHGEEGSQGREEAGRRGTRWERQQGPLAERLDGAAREQRPTGPAVCSLGGPEGLPVREGRAVLVTVRRHPRGGEVTARRR